MFTFSKKIFYNIKIYITSQNILEKAQLDSKGVLVHFLIKKILCQIFCKNITHAIVASGISPTVFFVAHV